MSDLVRKKNCWFSHAKSHFSFACKQSEMSVGILSRLLSLLTKLQTGVERIQEIQCSILKAYIVSCSKTLDFGDRYQTQDLLLQD